MSDEEEESLSEGFSASEEDEWKPGKDTRGGESSDDDDSDFEELPPGATATPNAAGGSSGRSPAGGSKQKQREQKAPSGIKGASVKKRKPSGQSLRSKLYNKYRPPPKTFPTSPTQQQNSPSASGSAGGAGRLTASKNAKTPNESNNAAAADSSSESSVEDYLVNPADIDLRSSFFMANKEKSPAPPQFDCNAGITNLSGSDSGSGSEDNNDSSLGDDNKAFDFRGLLENANSLERTREALLSKRTATPPAAATPPRTGGGGTTKNANNAAALDVEALLALGENQNYADEPEKENASKGSRSRACGAGGGGGGGTTRPGAAVEPPPLDAPSRLSKTKSTRIKRHTKTRPTSTVVAGGDTDDSDFEEVADDDEQEQQQQVEPNVSGDLEIHVGLPSRHLSKEQKTQHELEMALKRRMNRDIKDRQLLLHKVSLMCLISRSIQYNRLLGSSPELMQATLKLLPSKNAYPTERGVELKYLQSFVTWFKTSIKLLSQDLYPIKTGKKRPAIIDELLGQVRRKEARCKQDMIFIFIVLARGMGMNCRLICNLQPMALRPAASDLIPIKLKPDEPNKSVKSEADDEQEEELDEEEGKASKSKSKAKPVETKHVAKAKPVETKPTTAKAKPGETRPIKPGETKPTKPVDTKPTAASKPKEAAKVESKPSASSRLPRTAKKEGAELKPAAKKEAGELKPAANKEAGELKPAAKIEADKPKPRPKTAPKLKTSSSSVEHDEQPSTSRGSQRATASSAGSSAESRAKPQLSRLKREASVATSEVAELKKPKLQSQGATPVARRTRKASSNAERIAIRAAVSEKIGSPVIPKLVLPNSRPQKNQAKHSDAENANPRENPGRDLRSRSKSPKVHISPKFLKGGKEEPSAPEPASSSSKRNSLEAKARISPTFLKQAEPVRQLRTRQQKAKTLTIPQLDGGDDTPLGPVPKKRPKLEKLHSHSAATDTDSSSTPSKLIKKAPVLPKAVQHLRKDRRVLSTDDESVKDKRKTSASDMWVEVWSELEEQWICIDLFKGKLHCVDTIRRNASSNLAYVFAFQDDLSMKDVTARYCSSWTTTVRKARVEKAWLDETIAPYLGRRTKRDITEDEQLSRIHLNKPLPKSITEFKDHPLYVLKRHLLKFQGIYPADAPTLGFIRGEAVYSRDCVHLLHTRDIWLKSARVVKLGEQPYKIVKSPKWDKVNRTILKDQPVELFGYWQTQDYEPPTAENGLVPRNAYGNVELFKECMLPKKTVHLRLPGLMRVCKKLNIDCANAVIGFEFHQGGCHAMYDGFVVCEEFGEIVTAAWEEDQQEQVRKEREKYEARVYGNWKKLIKGLFIRERLKRKYNF